MKHFCGALVIVLVDVLLSVGEVALAERAAHLAYERAGGRLRDMHARQALGDVLKTCRTLVWNGPLGAFETPPFDAATVALAHIVAALTKEGSLVSVAGGGDTVAALNQAGVAGDFTYVSTAGGAFLEWMEGKPLPGVEVLRTK